MDHVHLVFNLGALFDYLLILLTKHRLDTKIKINNPAHL